MQDFLRKNTLRYAAMGGLRGIAFVLFAGRGLFSSEGVKSLRKGLLTVRRGAAKRLSERKYCTALGEGL